MSVAAVVVAWRAGERAGACLRRLAEVAPAARRVLVDNEAGNGPGTECSRRHGGPRAERQPRLRRRRQRRASRTRSRDGATHAVLLNDDVLVEPGCVEALVAAAGDRGAASPRIDGPPGVAFAGGELELVRGFGRHVDGARDYLSGACLCISRGAWEVVGPFNEELFLYYEDVEWCLRARALGVPLDGRARRTRRPQRRCLERRRRGRDVGLLLDAQSPLAARGRARRPRRAPRGGADAHAGAGALDRNRRAAPSRAPSLRVCTTGRSSRMGRGPWPR